MEYEFCFVYILLLYQLAQRKRAPQNKFKQICSCRSGSIGLLWVLSATLQSARHLMHLINDERALCALKARKFYYWTFNILKLFTFPPQKAQAPLLLTSGKGHKGSSTRKVTCLRPYYEFQAYLRENGFGTTGSAQKCQSAVLLYECFIGVGYPFDAKLGARATRNLNSEALFNITSPFS